MYRWIFPTYNLARGYSINKVPDLIAKHYLDAIKQTEGKPKFVKADDDTEYFVIQPLHVYFREVTRFILN